MFTHIRRICVLCVHTPRLGIVLQGLQPRLDQIQRLEEQRRAGAAERAAHKGFESWVSLRTKTDGEKDNRGERQRDEKGMGKTGDIRERSHGRKTHTKSGPGEKQRGG